MSIERIMEKVAGKPESSGRARPAGTFEEVARFKGQFMQLIVSRRGHDYSMAMRSAWEHPESKQASAYIRVRTTRPTLTTPSTVDEAFTAEYAKLMAEAAAEINRLQLEAHARQAAAQSAREDRRGGGGHAPQQPRVTGKTERERAKKRGKGQQQAEG